MSDFKKPFSWVCECKFLAFSKKNSYFFLLSCKLQKPLLH